MSTKPGQLLWKALHEVANESSSRRDWRERLGDEWAAASRYLKPTGGHALQIACPSPGGDGCMKRPIENNSSAGQAVYEPFSGSGTTIIAAEMTGRACHAIELNPAYVDVAVKRWQEFTGEAAVLDGNGRSFAEIEAERGAEVETAGGKTGAASRRIPEET